MIVVGYAVTLGTTIMGCAMKLASAYPLARVESGQQGEARTLQVLTADIAHRKT